jgi:hypothetical protein
MSFTTPVNVYSKTYWTGFISAVNEEAAYELGLHDKINEKALPKEGWSAAQFTPNILRYSDVYVDRSTNIDLSSRVIHEHHHHHTNSSSRPLSKEEQEAKKKEEEENSLQKYQWLGPIIGAIGAFLAAYTWRGYQRCKATYDHTHLVKNECKKLYDHITPLKPTLEKIVDKKLSVDELRYNILYRYFKACAGILVGGGLFTLGAYLKQPSLIPWGKIALAASAIWAAASAGLHLQDNQEIRSLYRAIVYDKEHSADQARMHLDCYYQEGMILKQEYVQPQPNVQYQESPFQTFFNNTQFVHITSPSFAPNYNPNFNYPVQEPGDMEFPLI